MLLLSPLFVQPQPHPLITKIGKRWLLSGNYIFNCYCKKNTNYWQMLKQLKQSTHFFFGKNVDANQMGPHGFN